MITPHTEGPWNCVRTQPDEYYTHQIESSGGHVASVTSWSQFGAACPTSEANARLIEHAPDLAAALRVLLDWDGLTGGWDAACWERARAVLEHATGGAFPTIAEPVKVANQMLDEAMPDEGWGEDVQLELLLDFLDAATRHDPVLAARLEAHLKNGGSP